jgi:hypothetical protein
MAKPHIRPLGATASVKNEVSFLAGDERPAAATPAIGPIESIGAESEAGGDAMVGGLAGLALGVIAAAIPGLGPVFMAGPLAAAFGGMAAGAAAGGVIGYLKDRGIEKKDAEFIAEGVAKGGALVTVHNLSEDRADKAREILKKFNAVDTENLADEREFARQ